MRKGMGKAVSVVAFLLLAMGLAGHDDQKTAAQLEENGYAAAKTYRQPAAYRLASPTLEEMEHLEHIRKVNALTAPSVELVEVR